MEGFTLVDGGAAIVLLISAFLAYSRGLVREILSIGGWVIAAIAGYFFAPQLEPLIAEIPILSDIIGSSCQLSIIAAFAVVFALTLIIVAIFTPLLAGAVQRSALSGFDQGLGFLFGILRGVVLLLAALVAYSFINAEIPMVDDSKTLEVLAGQQTVVQDAIEKDGEAGDASITGWLQSRYTELTTSCGKRESDSGRPKVTSPTPN